MIVLNPCPGGCSHLCLLSINDPRGYTCSCPDGMSLAEDQRSCIMEEGILLYSNVEAFYMIGVNLCECYDM